MTYLRGGSKKEAELRLGSRLEPSSLFVEILRSPFFGGGGAGPALSAVLPQG